MFENPPPVLENKTYTLKLIRLIIINKSEHVGLRKRVCLKTLCKIWMYAMHVCVPGASRSSPPHKSQKNELVLKYWTFFVRNRTQALDVRS